MKPRALSLRIIETQMHINHWKTSLRYWCLLAFAVFLVGCSTSPEEEYFDYFYTTKTTTERKSFTYILYIGSEKDHRIPDESRSPGGFNEREGKNTSNKRPKRSGEPKVDDFMSLSFRMEEEAFKRLEKKLLEKNYCSEEPDYSSSEYTWLTYTIKGTCG